MKSKGNLFVAISFLIDLLNRFNDRIIPGFSNAEKFSLGGVNSVRGYRENELVSDNGVIGSMELRIPLSSTLSN